MPKVEDATLRRLLQWFANAEEDYPLDPSYESEILPGTEDDYPPEVREKNQAIFWQLQKLNRCALVEPVGEKHMYHAAMNSKSCRLTRLGRHYHLLAQKAHLSH